MIDTIKKLNEKFNNKYNFLKLLNVFYDTETMQCIVTLLYSYQIEEISLEDREEVSKFYQEFLSLNGEVKVKFKKSFLDERLIVSEIIEYFKVNKKGIFPYITTDNIKASHIEQDVKIDLSLNQDIFAMIDEVELANSLKNYIEKLFIANVTVEIAENSNTLPEDIIANDIIPVATKHRRYEVKIEKKLIGGEIIPKPEFISDIDAPGNSVILAGFITNKNRKTFIAKKGKRAGEERVFYTFTLRDKEGSIDCIYFCPKTHEKLLEALDDMFMVICVGDVKHGLSGKLSYQIKKMALASPIENVVEEINSEENYVHKQVVFPDAMPRETQTSLFEDKPRYNDFIMKNDIVVFDLETTGLDPEMCEIIELGAVKIEHGEITQRFSSFAKPKFSIPDKITELTGITDEMVENAPRIEDVVYDFYEWSKGCVISGYNIVAFDLKFLKKVADQIGIKFTNEVIDTFIVVRQSSIKASNYKLGTIVKSLGITLKDAHRAYNDANATAQVLMALNKLK